MMKFIATGKNAQKTYASEQDAREAADYAPWANGKVFQVPDDFSGDPESSADACIVYLSPYPS